MKRLALGCVIATACAEEPGPLDREVVAEIARSRGDAQGGERTGSYYASFDVGACDCPADITLPLCLSQEFADTFDLELRVVEGDGFLTMTMVDSELLLLSGAIDEDGTATLGSVVIGFGYSTNLVVIGRLDGEFEDDGTLTATVQSSASGEFGGASLSCGSTFDVEAVRSG